MSRYSTNMLRTRRKDINVKPNRRDSRFARLDRKSSRGMIYENEELRLKTININAEIERGQYDIKKLKRENEMLKKEIWCLRDEYEKLDKLLKEKEIDFSSSSTTCSDSENCSSCSDDSDEVETNQNIENVQKTTNLKNFHHDFDHLSIVPEESTENSDRNSINNNSYEPSSSDWHYNNNNNNNDIKPDQNYENYEKTNNALYLTSNQYYHDYHLQQFQQQKTTNFNDNNPMIPLSNNDQIQMNADIIVKTDNNDFIMENPSQRISNTTTTQSSFSNGGNLEELLNDIETISKDILKISNQKPLAEDNNEQLQKKPFKSELNVVLMPNPMPLIGFEKYKNIQKSLESLKTKSLENLSSESNKECNPFFFGNLNQNNNSFSTTNLKDGSNSKMNLLDVTSSELISSENEENLKFKTTTTNNNKTEEKLETIKSPKLSIRRKVSIHFKGKSKETSEGGGGCGLKRLSIFSSNNNKTNHQKTPSSESKKSTDIEPKTPPSSSDSGMKKKPIELQSQSPTTSKPRKSVSVSPERRHHCEKKHRKHKKGDKKSYNRRSSDHLNNRERSYSICTDRSNILLGMNNGVNNDDYHSSANSLSSCETIKTRKMSNVSNVHLNGKVPWCACWGNGCI